MFDRAIKTVKPLNGAMSNAVSACKYCGFRIVFKSLSDKKFRITAREKMNFLNHNYCGAEFKISGFKIEDEVLITIITQCKIHFSSQETQAKALSDNYTSLLESLLKVQI